MPKYFAGKLGLELCEGEHVRTVIPIVLGERGRDD